MQSTSVEKEKINTKGTQKQDVYDMIVFCHLRWDFVYQRPQHVISRMAKNYKILFVEEPWHRPEEQGSRLNKISDMLHVLQPNTTNIDGIGAIIKEYADVNSDMIGWFYSPSFVPLLSHFNFSTIIYDCMDELSLFKGAPAELIDHEQYLIANADIVFTGGKSLYESKARLHDNVHCFPSSVDRAHFAKALNGIAVPEDIASVKSPIVGYCGVIDERINMELLNEAAGRMPEVAFVMIGPLAKIGEHDLPRRENIHYLGMKDYIELPAYIKAFKLAMMPFALNDATKYISPTKTLEYMAAHKPIISTAITDVVRDYAHCVSIVHNADDFENAVTAALGIEANVMMNGDYERILDQTSWDNTVAKMQSHIKAIAE
ncbi:glycosyltransferase [Flavobacterium sp. J372]|uniref:glycosyltransferase n=1 Tax=Flavobacterium sp. J372 TaxID=2898436 RepID=UPI002151D160|nr:glycosyltransferase [Flavobacterium sp. J372]MCR5862064.1 glycosyltransferase [Flavobacterium sp. J372]